MHRLLEDEGHSDSLPRRSIGSRLYVASGDPVAVLPRLWREFGVTHLTFEEDETLEPYALKRDQGGGLISDLFHQ